MTKPQSRWRPKVGETYWYISSCGDLVKGYFDDQPLGGARIEYGNCFKSQKEAIRCKAKIKVIFLAY